MNGGQVATRGFLLQTLMALLDMLDSSKQIKSLRLEPTTKDDKTDFVIEYANGHKKAVQVKSSQNQIGLPDVKKWAAKLKADFVADEYELYLIGPCSSEITKENNINGVTIPTPKSLDVKGMFEQASHRLNKYLYDCLDEQPYSPTLCELIVEGLIGKLSSYSTAGTPVYNSDLTKVFSDWKSEIETQASKEIKKQFGNGKLTDLDALKEYKAQFDRPALQDALRRCGKYKDFSDALSDLVSLLNTGTIRGQFVTKRRADFVSQKWQQSLGDVYHDVRELREWYTKLVRSGEIDESTCTCKLQESIYHDFEAKKRKIVIIFNDLLHDACLPPIRGVP